MSLKMKHVIIILICVLIFRSIKGENNGCVLNAIKGGAAGIIGIYLVGLLIFILTMMIMLLVEILDFI